MSAMSEDAEQGPALASAVQPRPDSRAIFAEAVAASRLRLKDKLLSVLEARPDVLNQQDSEGRTCLHFVAEHCEGLEELLAVADINCCLEDKNGDAPLHFAAMANCPMAAYALAKSCPRTCLARNKGGNTPVNVAQDKCYGEVLNAMLLACCSNDANPKDSSSDALQAIKMLLEAGAVPDTWAPNGNSALMMAASADSPKSIELLLGKSAQINMKDTLGRTALMFAAGNDARNALVALMDAGGQQALSLQDNRGNNVLKYACGEEVKHLVERRFAELETAANANEAALLAALEAEEQTAASAKQKRAHRGKKKKKCSKSQPVDASPTTTEKPGLDNEDSSYAEEALMADPDRHSKVEKNGSLHRNQGHADGDAVKTVKLQVPEAISIRADASSLPEESLSPDCSTAYTTAPDSIPEHSTDQDAGCDSLTEGSWELAGGKQESKQSRQSTKNPGPNAGNGGSEQESRAGISQADRDAIREALGEEASAAGKQEQSWQEVKKPSKTAHGKPPLAKRSAEKFFDATHSLLPSSSSASLDSLGDSSASVASARSFPSSVLQAVQQMTAAQQTQQAATVPHPQPQHCGSSPLDQQVPKPLPSPCTSGQMRAPGPLPGATSPEDSCRDMVKSGGGLTNPDVSWVSVVQGKSQATLCNSLSAPDLATLEDPSLQSRAPDSAAPGHAEGKPPADCKQTETELRRENAELRQRWMQAEVSKCELEAQIRDFAQRFQDTVVSLQTEHRLLLQKAVEDTAVKVLAQQEQRYGRQIEALKVLLLQAHQQLVSQSQQQQQRPQQAPSHFTPPVAVPGSSSRLTTAVSKGQSQAGSMTQLLNTPPSFLVPQSLRQQKEGSSVVPSLPIQSGSPSARTPSMRAFAPALPKKAARSLSHTLGEWEAAADPSPPVPFTSLQGLTGPAGDNLTAAQQWPLLTCTSHSAGGSPGSAVPRSLAARSPAINPWATFKGPDESSKETHKSTNRPQLPFLDSIWGPAGGMPKAQPIAALAASQASEEAVPLVRSFTEEFSGDTRKAFLTPALANSL